MRVLAFLRIIIMSLLMAVCLRLAAQDRAIISVENAAGLTQIDQLGYGAITATAWSDDGRTLALGMAQEIRIYRAGQADPLVIPNQHLIRSIALRPDGRVFAAIDKLGILRVWNTDTGQVINTWKGDPIWSPSRLLFVPATHEIAFYEMRPDGSDFFRSFIRFWAYETDKEPFTIENTFAQIEGGITVNQDGSLIITSTHISQMGSGVIFGTAIIRSRSTGERRDFGLQTAQANQFLFSPTESNIFVSIDADGIVRFFNISKNTELFALTLPVGRVTMAAFSSDGTTLATSGADRTVRLWDTHNGALLEVFHDQPWAIQQLRIQPDGQILAFADPFYNAIVWDAHTGDPVNEVLVEQATPPLIDMRFDPTGTHLLTAGTDGTLRQWDINRQQDTIVQQVERMVWDRVSISETGAKAAWMDAETSGIWLWQVDEGASPVAYPFDPVDRITAFGFTPDGHHVIAATYGNRQVYDYYTDEIPVRVTNTLWTWAAESEPPVIPALKYDNWQHDEWQGVTTFAYIPDSSQMVYILGDVLWQRDVKSGKEVVLQSTSLSSRSVLGFTLDGQFLVVVSDQTVSLWDTETWTLNRTFSLQLTRYGEMHITFHPKGRLMGISIGEELQVYDLIDSTRLASIHAHESTITQVAFNLTGSVIATSSLDGTLHLWGIP